MGSTKEQIVEAAESLFAEKGFSATSIRDISAKADVNLAAINYHFGSKSSLLKHIIKLRITPLNRRRLEMLEQERSACGNNPIPVKKLLGIMILPAMELWNRNPSFTRLAGRLYYEPDKRFRFFFLNQFKSIARLFSNELSRSLPSIPREELMWRTFFIIGSMIHIWTGYHDIEYVTGGMCRVSNWKQMSDKLISFGFSGLKAPAKCKRKKGG